MTPLHRAIPTLPTCTHLVACAVAAAICVCCAINATVIAQDGRPDPARPGADTTEQDPPTQGEDDRPAPAGADREASDEPIVDIRERPRTTVNNRHPLVEDDTEIQFTFNNVSINEFIPFITETTGKVVMPIGATLQTRNITIVAPRFMTRMQALDYIFEAFQLNGIGIIETEDTIIIDSIDKIRNFRQHPVVPADVDVSEFQDRGATIVKIFKLEHAAASDVSDQLGDMPEGASVSVDASSNQLLLLAPVSVAQHIQKLIDQIDIPPFDRARTRVFPLSYADATVVADNIQVIFEQSPDAGGGARNISPAQARRAAQQDQGASPGSGIEPAPLKITVNPQLNAIVVQADMALMPQIEDMINNQLDKPISAQVIRTYDLANTDPIKVRDVLQELLAGGSQFRPGQAAPGRGQQPGQAGGGGTQVSDIIGRIYNIQAYPDSQRLIVIAKTPDVFPLLDTLIEQIDQPVDPGLPLFIQLRHADAENVARILNILLAQSGTPNLQLPPRQEGLQDIAGLGGDDAGTGARGAGGQQGAAQAQMITFPWQESREDQADPPLAGKVRIVPIYEQNAVALLGPPEYREAIRRMIEEDFDRPGRQVMISVVIAEIRLTDALNLGLRFSSGDLNFDRPDTALSATAGVDATEDNVFGSLFDTSVLDVGFNLNVLLQALRQKDAVRILQQPRIFTADNQQASFFDGQQVPFITGSVQSGDFGGVTQSFDREDVGIQLLVRPRITREQHVDMEISLELASIAPEEAPFGQFIVDKRRTDTKLIVKNGQTIVISGILQETDSEVTRKIPLLGDIPIIGELFTSRSNSTIRSELVAFITPIVVENPSDNDTNFNVQEREKLENMTRPLDHQKERLGEEDFARDPILEFRRDGAVIDPDDDSANDDDGGND